MHLFEFDLLQGIFAVLTAYAVLSLLPLWFARSLSPVRWPVRQSISECGTGKRVRPISREQTGRQCYFIDIDRYRLILSPTKSEKDFSSRWPAIAFLHLFCFHSLLCLTSFLSQNKKLKLKTCEAPHVANWVLFLKAFDHTLSAPCSDVDFA